MYEVRWRRPSGNDMKARVGPMSGPSPTNTAATTRHATICGRPRRGAASGAASIIDAPMQFRMSTRSRSCQSQKKLSAYSCSRNR